MNICNFHILWPGGNTTAIVDSYPAGVPLKDIANRVMDAYPNIEQVGFIEPSRLGEGDLRLQMMGGEFCGNAARSFAFLLNQKMQVKEKDMLVEVSGLESLVKATVLEDYAGIVLPKHFFVKKWNEQGLTVVDLAGIRHIVVANKSPRDLSPEKVINKYKSQGIPAIGVMYTTLKNGVYEIDPFVWVEDIDRIIHETACGSGSIAVAHAFKDTRPNTQFTIKQPSASTFNVSIHAEEEHISLGGKIKYLGQKQITIK